MEMQDLYHARGCHLSLFVTVSSSGLIFTSPIDFFFFFIQIANICFPLRSYSISSLFHKWIIQVILRLAFIEFHI